MPKSTGGRKQAPSATRTVLVIHGPNLNLLGKREPAIYGSDTLETINQQLTRYGADHGVQVECFQSKHEGELIERVHAAKVQGTAFIVINPGGFTHTSVALRDALAGVSIPFIEVHLSNVHAREAFRRRSYFSDLAVGTICGLGSRGYEFALAYAIEH